MASHSSRKTKTTSSQDSINIPPEIITKILYHLPSKSVARFRCVSKEWLSQLSSPEFIKTHQNTLNRTHVIYLSYDEFSLCSLPLIDHHENSVLRPAQHLISDYHYYITFHGSCNGLVFVSYHNFIRIVFNPITSEFRILPKAGYRVVDKVSNSQIAYGFGYDSVNDDYKVVTISNHYDFSHNVHVHVYSLRTNTWKWVCNSPYDHCHYWRSYPGVFVNGFLHWFAKKYSDDVPVIVAFDLGDHKFNEVPLPSIGIVTKEGCKLVDVGGKLGIFLNFVGEVWLMNEYGIKESWTKILLHELNEIRMVQPMIFLSQWQNSSG